MRAPTLARAAETERGELPRLRGLLDEEFLRGVGWEAHRLTLSVPPGHPTLGYAACRVEDCTTAVAHRTGLCETCQEHWQASDLAMDAFLAGFQSRNRKVGEGRCSVRGCQRLAVRCQRLLCLSHDGMRRKRGLSLREFLNHQDARPLASLGACRVVACVRSRQITQPPFCLAHAAAWSRELARDPGADFERWRRDCPAVAEPGLVSLTGLAPLVVTQILVGLQRRYADGVKTQLRVLRSLAFKLRGRTVTTLVDLDLATDTPLGGRAVRALHRAITAHCRWALSSPAAERGKDVWELVVFGHGGTLDFTGIRQPWLREAAKAWAFEDLPQRRGSAVSAVLRTKLAAIAQLSDSLRVQRDDHGLDTRRLGRGDIVALLNRLAHLETSGQLTRYTRTRTCWDTARLLRDLRGLGLTRAGQPMAGLPDDFAFRRGDAPTDLDDEGAGRALPETAMRQLTAALPWLEELSSRETRVAVSLLMDTGRRPDEVCRLPLDCLGQDADGKHVLIYEDFKRHRKGRRLPVADATAALIAEQQHSVRVRFPNTARAELALLPAPTRNPHGRRRFDHAYLSEVHRKWVTALPPLLRPDGSPVNEAMVVPYAYRHSYAQRHADAGVPVDVLRDLMSHKQLDTTQHYYRVTERRTRNAVDQVTAYQFDRHGNRLWREAQTLLDHERIRLGIGQIAVPYGICTEPTNVQAGGRACPFRFRCVGCAHFRTDASHLPDLRAYLQDLLRDKERVLAATDLDEWARAEAMPSDEEINKVRQLISRVESDLDALTPEERVLLEEAVGALRRTRRVVGLGMPAIRANAPSGGSQPA